MNKEEIFAIWADESAVWSRWAKPVLFAHLDATNPEWGTDAPASLQYDATLFPPARKSTALLVDLPGAEGVHTALLLAEQGYRPVPLYNAVPLPILGSVAAVDVPPIIHALRECAPRLAAITIPNDAPPAFLLDAGRQGDGAKPLPDRFDNRSICFTTDFPSANFLAAHGIEKVLLIQKSTLVPQSDLVHMLRRWQDGGIRLERARLEPPTNPQAFEVPKPKWYAAMFQRALAGLGFHPSPHGGFGNWMNDSEAGG